MNHKAPRGALFVSGPITVLVAFLLLGAAIPPLFAGFGTETATVRHVVDGDSVILTDGRQIRLIGINAPELGRDGDQRRGYVPRR